MNGPQMWTCYSTKRPCVVVQSRVLLNIFGKSHKSSRTDRQQDYEGTFILLFVYASFIPCLIHPSRQRWLFPLFLLNNKSWCWKEKQWCTRKGPKSFKSRDSFKNYVLTGFFKESKSFIWLHINSSWNCDLLTVAF